MRKIIFLVLVLVGTTTAFAQSADFGVTAGYTNINAKAKASDGNNSVSLSDDASGFYVGVLLDIEIEGNFHVQPEALFALAEDTKFLYIPILAKYYISDSGFHLLAGPQANIILEESGGTKTFGLDITFGAGYDINEHFFIDARYSFEVTNRLDKNDYDAKLRANTLNVGVGYKF